MKDVRKILYQKEQDLKRVRKEIQSLLIVIPVLAEQKPAAPDLMQLLDRAVVESSANGMADLEAYYPFLRSVETSKRTNRG